MNIDKIQLQEIQEVHEFQENTDYNTLQIPETIEYMHKLYIQPAQNYINITDATLCDCAAGFGWLAFAFLMSGGKRAIIVEPLESKLNAAQKIATILGIVDRCEFRTDYIQDLDLPDNSIDIFASIETLEHVGKDNIKSSINNIIRITAKLLIITTPNQLSPLVSHDGKVPFSHWLPKDLRKHYVRLFGKKIVHFNDFVSFFDMLPILQKFQPQSKTLTFPSYEAWLSHYPFYSPYSKGTWKHSPSMPMKLFFLVTSKLFGRYAFVVCPNLACIWVAKQHNLPITKVDPQVKTETGRV